MSGRGTASGVRGESQAFSGNRPGATCPCEQTDRQLRAGVFFDGTNNNRFRDEPRQGHTNVVRLYTLP